jgi:putative membrane protein
MTVSMVLLWGLVILGVVALVRYLARAPRHIEGAVAQRLAPEQMLAERFARGEIDEQEYQSRLAILASSTLSPAVSRPSRHDDLL